MLIYIIFEYNDYFYFALFSLKQYLMLLYLMFPNFMSLEKMFCFIFPLALENKTGYQQECYRGNLEIGISAYVMGTDKVCQSICLEGQEASLESVRV